MLAGELQVLPGGLQALLAGRGAGEQSVLGPAPDLALRVHVCWSAEVLGVCELGALGGRLRWRVVPAYQVARGSECSSEALVSE